jgi:hypothetical protein
VIAAEALQPDKVGRIAQQELPEDLCKALSVIESCYMGFFLELAVGLLIRSLHSEAVPSERIPYVARLVPGGTLLTMTDQIIQEAARCWIQLALVIDQDRLFKKRTPHSLAPDDSKRIQDLFSLEVSYELLERMSDAGRIDAPAPDISIFLQSRYEELSGRRESLVSFLNGLPSLPLTKDLICCWFPAWHRLPFILRSFDQPGSTSVLFDGIDSRGDWVRK